MKETISEDNFGTERVTYLESAEKNQHSYSGPTTYLFDCCLGVVIQRRRLVFESCYLVGSQI